MTADADADAVAAVVALLLTRTDGPPETALQRWRRERVAANRLPDKRSRGFASLR